MPEVKVYYFHLKGAGEAIRMMLAYAGQNFKDIRVSKEDWLTMKSEMPFGQMPILEIDGKKYAQSVAIARYLGRKYGLSGQDIEEDFEIDQAMDFFSDIRTRAAAVFYQPNAEQKAKVQEENEKEHYPTMLKTLDEIIKKNDGHMAIGKLTWGDFVFAGMYDCFKMVLKLPNLDEQYPSFKELQDKVIALPKVKAYCDKAPPTDW